MPFALHPAHSNISAAIRRVASEEIAAALEAARDSDPETLAARVHSMRKSVKKLRGLIRLVRPVMPAFAAENKALRNAGRDIAALREAEVMLQTARALARDLPPEDRDRLIAPFAAALALAADPVTLAAQLAPFEEAFTALAKRAKRWKIKGEGFDALAPGLKETWKEAQIAMAFALANPGVDQSHEWRKRTKDHWHQARLIAPAFPKMMAAHEATLRQLGDLLGASNDLAEFDARLRGMDMPHTLQDHVAHVIKARQEQLHADAAKLGRLIYAESAKSLTRRWAAWWDITRRATPEMLPKAAHALAADMAPPLADKEPDPVTGLTDAA